MRQYRSVAIADENTKEIVQTINYYMNEDHKTFAEVIDHDKKDEKMAKITVLNPVSSMPLAKARM